MSNFVIQQPRSSTNPTDQYRVVCYQDWIAFVNGAKTSFVAIGCKTYEEALVVQDEANRAGLHGREL